MERIWQLTAFLILSGCTHIEYEHLSDPRISNDGYDLVCVGRGDNVSLAICKNLNGGEAIKFNVRLEG